VPVRRFGQRSLHGGRVVRPAAPPERIASKAPTADLEDLRPGVSDAAVLGVTYRDIDDYLEGRPVPFASAAHIEAIFRATEHKRRGPVTPQDTWWRPGV